MSPSATLQLLQRDLVRLPKDLGGSEITQFLRDLYGQFQLALAGLDDATGEEIRARRAAISSLCESVLEAVRAVRQERMDSAVALLGPALEGVRGELLTVARQNEETVLRGQSLYRVRESRNGPLSSPLDLFHLPRKLRHLASAVRYSVREWPCLYLANSIYTCWTECRLPEITCCSTERLDAIYAARFEFARPALVLDFCYPPWALADALAWLESPPIAELAGASLMNAPVGPDPDARVRYLASWLAIWPLLAAVSLRTPEEAPADGVKPEYLVPQVLMVWVQQSLSFDGIRYFSTRERPGQNTNDYAIDYAFPVKTPLTTERCPVLTRLFLSTRPLPFGAVARANLSDLLSDKEFDLAERKFRRYTIVDENAVRHYYGTTYCDMEYALDVLPPESLES